MGKEKIDKRLEAVLSAGDKIFVPYMMAGDGGLEKLNETIQFLDESGASLIELGIPFSDPVADGETIQQAGLRALREGVTLKKILIELKQSKDRQVPIVLMTYINPIFHYGLDTFIRDAVEAGVDGFIIPDLPMEEEDIVAKPFKDAGMALVRLVALTSPKKRRDALKDITEGFLYAVTVTGTTGARQTFDESVYTYLNDLKENAKTPVLAGFGISSREQVKKLSEACDGVVVGSHIVKALHEGDKQKVVELIQAAKKA